MNSIRSFPSNGIRRAVVEDPATAQFQTGRKGTLRFSDAELSFEDWRVKYKNIKAATLRVQRAAFWPTYMLILTDGLNNYLFHIPRAEAKTPFPFTVQTESTGGFSRVIVWVWLGSLALSGLVALASLVLR